MEGVYISLLCFEDEPRQLRLIFTSLTHSLYLYLSYPFITPSPNTGQPEMLTSISNLFFKPWDFSPCASDMLSDSIPSLTRNLKSIPSCSYFLRQSAFCPLNVYFSKETYFHLKKKDINPIHTCLLTM